ncbi:unnamed protein product [Bursaphelenchus xylophilus]|uniref:(pine wood nematode) hypothetical protein n=1 Tax=Bursaphelenchus xylophilus TaxID=6326 RepID=A0A1I7RNY2_BURXY|nr:unnamed protein product [Bursaphelenchus xylophilus]CAG9124382.1 unnamed protein product [Bursaphelenchus xylophilus]
MNIAEHSAEIPLNPSRQQLEREKALNMERVRKQLSDVNIRDLVPTLVARQVLQTYEMGAVYAKTDPDGQLDKLIELLRTRNHWLGPLIDALIRNGQTSVAESLLLNTQSEM